MSTWSRGRVTLVGDAGYCPGPGVGGSTSLAVYGAYVLAHAVTAARGDHPAAFAAYERMMAAPVAGSRTMARVNAKTIVPGSDWGARALLGIARTVSALPRGLTQRLARLNSNGVRLYDTMPLPD
ncbi:FAD-dependent monooxygenase [Mycolicibacterium aubagnense]